MMMRLMASVEYQGLRRVPPSNFQLMTCEQLPATPFERPVEDALTAVPCNRNADLRSNLAPGNA